MISPSGSSNVVGSSDDNKTEMEHSNNNLSNYFLTLKWLFLAIIISLSAVFVFDTIISFLKGGSRQDSFFGSSSTPSSSSSYSSAISDELHNPAKYQSWLEENDLAQYSEDFKQLGVVSLVSVVQLDQLTQEDRVDSSKLNDDTSKSLSRPPINIPAQDRERLKRAALILRQRLILRLWLDDHGLLEYAPKLNQFGLNSIEDAYWFEDIEKVQAAVGGKVVPMWNIARLQLPVQLSDLEHLKSTLWNRLVSLDQQSMWNTWGTMLLVTLSVTGFAAVASYFPQILDAKQAIFQYVSGKFSLASNCKVEFEWEDPAPVGKTVSFNIRFHQRGGRPYPICDKDNILIEVKKDNQKVAVVTEFGGKDPSDANLTAIKFSVRKAGQYHVHVIVENTCVLVMEDKECSYSYLLKEINEKRVVITTESPQRCRVHDIINWLESPYRKYDENSFVTPKKMYLFLQVLNMKMRKGQTNESLNLTASPKKLVPLTPMKAASRSPMKLIKTPVEDNSKEKKKKGKAKVIEIVKTPKEVALDMIAEYEKNWKGDQPYHKKDEKFLRFDGQGVAGKKKCTMWSCNFITTAAVTCEGSCEGDGCPHEITPPVYCSKNKRTTKKTDVYDHYWTAHLNQAYTCTECTEPKTFQKFAALVTHVAACHMGQRYHCNIDDCDKSYTEAAILKRHQTSFHEGVRWFCDFQNPHAERKRGRPFTKKGNLTNHVETVHNHKMWFCDNTFLDEDGESVECGEGVYNRGELWNHKEYFHHEDVIKRSFCHPCNYQPRSQTAEKVHYASARHRTKETLLKFFELKEGSFGVSTADLIAKARAEVVQMKIDPNDIRLILHPNLPGVIKPKDSQNGTMTCGGKDECKCTLKLHFTGSENFLILDKFALKVNGLFDCHSSHITYAITCAVHSMIFYIGLTDGEAKARWSTELSLIRIFTLERHNFFKKNHNMSDKDREEFYTHLEKIGRLREYTHMIAHFSECDCFWLNVRFHGICQYEGPKETALEEAYYQLLSDSTNFDVGGRNMVQGHGQPNVGTNVHYIKDRDRHDAIPIHVIQKLLALAPDECLRGEERSVLQSKNMPPKRLLFTTKKAALQE